MTVTGIVWVVYPALEIFSVYEPVESPWKSTCPGGVQPEVNVNEISPIAGVTVAVFVVRYAM